jgi:meiotically up-regulated gene 157 (Mug157) protein
MDFKKYEKELKKAGYIISGDMVSNSRGDVVGQMDPYGAFHCSDHEMAKVICAAMQAEEETPVTKKTTTKKKRAHDEDGHFKADDPSTTDLNEAWED